MTSGQSIAQSQYWHNRALKIIPGGVSSPVRAFSSVGGTPRYFVEGRGSRVVDVDGNEYVDLVGSWGPMIVGHAHPHVVQRVVESAAKSSSFGAPGPNEVLLAEEMQRRVSAIERVRFVSSGTEAVMTAVRLARAATGRNVIVKFVGCYHGHADSLLVQAGSGVLTLGLPNSPGVTPGQAQDTVAVAYNDIEAITSLFVQRGHEIAAVLTEAIPANMGVVPPIPGFNALLSKLCKKYGALFILDEVMTGFRVSSGGLWNLVKYEEAWTPDLFTYGKVIGGGYPVAAVAGSANVMDLLAPVGAVYQAGTLSGNPVATAAGLATLELCDDALYATLDRRATEVGQVVSEALTEQGVAHRLQFGGNLFSIFFSPDEVRSFEDTQHQDVKKFAAFFHAMLAQGVSLPPSAYEAWFVSGAHTDGDIALIASASKVAAVEAARTTS
ncbi:MAG: glutamate-1-semialdehyde 2,1-aminomutase [Candidatus Nanopelagicaceae bacterium]|nr:glutamate-1-semialdehyde 2,1-aminomutase [Candidatus Nanopelagicaceae bacterium]